MRITLFILLALNGLLVAATLGWLPSFAEGSTEPQRVGAQKAAAQLQILSGEPAMKVIGPSLATDAAAATNGIRAANPSTSLTAGSAAGSFSSTSSVCLEVGPYSPQEADMAAVAMASAIGNKYGSATVEKVVRDEPAQFLVYLPPSSNNRDALIKEAELKRLGAAETYVFPDGVLQHAISLGIFSSQEAATQMQGTWGNKLNGVKGFNAVADAPTIQAKAAVTKVTLKLQESSLRASGLRSALNDFPIKDCGASR
jgi:hypothetical protein